MAMPIPPPTHKVAMPFFSPRFIISCTRVYMMRVPEQPTG